MEYKKKLKLKKVPDVTVKQPEEDKPKMDLSATGSPKLAGVKVNMGSTHNKGKVLKIKSKGISEPSLMDLRAITDEEGKKLLEEGRIKRELKIRRKIKGM